MAIFHSKLEMKFRVSCKFSFRRVALLAMIALVVLSGCKKAKPLSETKDPLRHKPAGFLLRQNEKNQFNFEWLAMKVDAEMSAKGESRGFKANIRMRRDSVIWISISPALGIEVFRVLITPDSVKYISRIPDDKYYYAGGFTAVTDLAGVDMDFNMIQDLLIGNAVGIDNDETKFRSEIDEFNYLLISKYRRKVRRAVGVDDRKLNPQDSLTVNPNDPRYQRAVKKSDEEDLIISRYWLDGERYRLVKSIFNDLINQRAVEIEYADFVEETGQFYPSNCRLKVRDPLREQEINFKITKLVIGKTSDFPFEIPSDFERKLTP